MKSVIMNLYPLICVFIICILYQAMAIRKCRDENRKKILIHFILAYVFILYIYLALKVAGIGSIWDIGYYETVIRINEIQLIPLKYGITMTHILNIIMFIPLGFILPLVWQKYRKVFQTIFVGAIFSLLIEFTQLFNLRTTDVDDLIMNILGAIIGYYMWFLFSLCFKNKKHETFSLTKNEPIIYVVLSILGMFFLYNWKFIFELLYL